MLGMTKKYNFTVKLKLHSIKNVKMNWKKLIVTGFGAGYLPIGPGSWGTFPGMFLCWLMQVLSSVFYLGFILLLGWVTVPLVTEIEKQLGKKDHGAIVIDEIIAFPLTMFLIPLSLGTLLLGFFLNRLMDTLKPWPCKRFEELQGGWGVMLDDLMAAIYSCIGMHFALHFWPHLSTFYSIAAPFS